MFIILLYIILYRGVHFFYVDWLLCDLPHSLCHHLLDSARSDTHLSSMLIHVMHDVHVYMYVYMHVYEHAVKLCVYMHCVRMYLHVLVECKLFSVGVKFSVGLHEQANMYMYT